MNWVGAKATAVNQLLKSQVIVPEPFRNILGNGIAEVVL